VYWFLVCSCRYHDNMWIHLLHKSKYAYNGIENGVLYLNLAKYLHILLRTCISKYFEIEIGRLIFLAWKINFLPSCYEQKCISALCKLKIVFFVSLIEIGLWFEQVLFEYQLGDFGDHLVHRHPSSCAGITTDFWFTTIVNHLGLWNVPHVVSYVK